MKGRSEYRQRIREWSEPSHRCAQENNTAAGLCITFIFHVKDADNYHAVTNIDSATSNTILYHIQSDEDDG